MSVANLHPTHATDYLVRELRDVRGRLATHAAYLQDLFVDLLEQRLHDPYSWVEALDEYAELTRELETKERAVLEHASLRPAGGAEGG